MSEYIFEMPGDLTDIAEYEIISLFSSYGIKNVSFRRCLRVMIVKVDDYSNNLTDESEDYNRRDSDIKTAHDMKRIFERICLTHKILEYCYEVKAENISGTDLENDLHDNDLHYKEKIIDLNGKTFSIDIVRHNAYFSEIPGIYFKKYIGHGILNGSADLKNPQISVCGIVSDKIYVGKVIKNVDKKYLSERSPEKKPFSKPVSLSPRLARAMLNISMAPENSLVVDPLSGTGAVLIEAGLMNIRHVGGDISEEMCLGAELNLRHYNIIPEIHICSIKDFPKINADAIITDPPYGRSSYIEGESIYEIYDDLKNLALRLLDKDRRLIVILPEDNPGIFCPLKHIRTFPIRVHRSLTRYLMVFKV